MKKKKWLARMAVITVFLLVITMAMAVKVLAFDDYYVSEDNSFSFTIAQKKASSSATIKYGTGAWYFFPAPIDAAYYDEIPNDSEDYPNHRGQSINASFYNSVGMSSSSATQTRLGEDDTYKYDKFTFSAEDVMNAMKKWHNLGSLSRDQLTQGITLYASRSLKVIKNGSTIGTVYSYPEMEAFSEAKGIDWSDKAWDTFGDSYDVAINVRFAKVGLTKQVVDENGKPITEAYDESYTAFPYNDIYYGEKITNLSYPGKITGYQYTGWELSAGSWSRSGSGTSVNYTASYADLQGNNLVLTFKYKKVEAEMPFGTPTPEPTQAPGATATPTPKPTSTPTPAPPTPTPQPSGHSEDMKTKDWYYSTDQGHYIGKVMSNSAYYLANMSSVDGTTIGSADATKLDKYYSTGTDSNGNEWYFLISGSNAVLVHPKKYNGYVVDSENIKYITELVFPSTLTLYGTTNTYTVTSIGGGGGYYRSDLYSSGSGTTSFNYGAISGYYYYGTDSSNSSQTTSTSHYISYAYGVMGNGYIKSNGYRYYYYHVSDGSSLYDYDQNYYFYNTTLKKIVIPSTVTSIEEYAFLNCQALETIEGGANLKTISSSAFAVDGDPEIKLSRDYTKDQEKISLYYYYNGSSSTSAYTSQMLAWRSASFLSDELVFPYLPKLTYIGSSAFSEHHNIDEVDLSATVSEIMQYAFNGCKLERIRIPNASCKIGQTTGTVNAEAQRATLGTKGYDESGNATEIHCKPDSTAMDYGLLHDGYYILYCGHPVTYQPNGAPGSAQEVSGSLNIHYGTVDSNGIRLTYPNYKANVYDSYYYNETDCQYQSYLSPEGKLWLLDTTNKTMTEVSPGTTFTELIQINSAHFAKDSNGNLWVSGQQSGVGYYTDSWGDYSQYTYYSDWFNWRKMSLPSGTVKTQLSDRAVYALDSSGIVWRCNISSQSNNRLNTGSPAFVDFSYDSVSGEQVVYGIDAEGTIYRSNSSYSAWISGTGGKKVAIIESPYASGTTFAMVLMPSGELRMYSGINSCVTKSGYNFTDMETSTFLGKSGAMLKDASGSTYLATVDKNRAIHVTKIASAGVGIREMWSSQHSFSTNGHNIDGGIYSGYSQPRTYVWTDDGYLTVHSGQTESFDPYDYTWSNTTHMSYTSWRVADVKFKKLVYDVSYEYIFGIAEDGTLWSGGKNPYGQLGDGKAYGYDVPPTATSAYMTKTGSRTYTDVYPNGSGSWAIALGTDGKVYYSGRKPTEDYNSLVSSDTRNSFAALGEGYTWPQKASLGRLRTGFDYNTIIASNPYTYSGYEFKGWNTAANGSGTAYYPGDAVELTGAITVYAQWGRANNVIRYDRNGGSGTMASTVLAYDVTTTTLSKNTFAKEGYEFAGWNTSANGSGTSYADGASITVAKGSTTTLYAQWREIVTSYTLVYMKYPYGTAGNTAWKSKNLSYRTVETVEGQPYTPSGAYTVSYNINKPSTMSTVPSALAKTSDSTPAPVFNKWQLYMKNTDGEYVYSGRQYAKGNTLSQLTKENGGTVYLYPSWNTVGSYVVLPYTEADGYVFEGWSETADGSSVIYPVYPPEDEENIGTFTPAKNTTLYGVWTPVTKTVTLDATNKAAAAAGMSASVTNPQTSATITYDAKTPDILAPSCNRWVFMGYYTKLDSAGNPTADSVQITDTNRNSDGTYATYTKGITIMNNKNGTFDTVTTLYAYWVPDKAVSYEPNYSPLDADCPSMETTWVDFDKDYADISEIRFTRRGYSFVNWNTNPDGTGTAYADKARVTGITGRVVLYAQWKPNKYTVELSQPNATTPGTTSVTATYDAAMPTITVPKRSYEVTFNANTGSCGTVTLTSKYIFGGYYSGTNGTGTQYYKADGTSARIWNIAEDTTLHEKWTSVSVTLPTPTKTGYTFQGWYTAASGGTKIGNAGATYTPTADIELYAQWKANEYTVTFDWNFNWDEIGIDTNTNWTGNTKGVTYDSAYGTLPHPTREGYEFEGWYTDEDAEGNGGGTQILAATIVKTPNDHTLYAKWSIRYMESADIWLKTLRKEVSAVASGTPNLLQMLELGDTLLNLTVTTDGFFDYMKITAPWRAPITVDFDDGTFDKANKIWYLPNEDYIQFFAAGGDPTAVRNNPGYTNENHLITIDFYKKDGTILITYKVNVIFIPYDVWNNDVIIGREPTT